MEYKEKKENIYVQIHKTEGIDIHMKIAGKSFIKGAAILVAAGMLTRALGFVYRIYLSNLIGAEGMGLISLTGPVYSLIILTLTSGVSIAVSRLTAEEKAKGNECNTGKITKMAALIVGTGGLLAAGILMLTGHFVADVILKDSRTYLSLMALVPCIPIVACQSAIKGYFYGSQNVAPNALANIVEQTVRIGLVLALLQYAMGLGLEYTCALVTVGSAIGEIFNLGVVFVAYIIDRKKIKRTGTPMRKRDIGKTIASIEVPVSATRFISSVIGTVESILIPRRLLAGGLDYSGSLAELGRLSGMVSPLIFFPSVITSALATTLVPAISEAVSVKNYPLANRRISKSLNMSFMMGFVFMAVFMSFPDEIGGILYAKENIGGMLYMMSFTCIFIYVQQTLTGILNGFDKQKEAFISSLIGDILKIGFVWFAVPVYGVKGYVMGLITSEIIVCLINLRTIIKSTGMSVDLRNWIIRPGGVFALMFLLSKAIRSAVTVIPVDVRVQTFLMVGIQLVIALLALKIIKDKSKVR